MSRCPTRRKRSWARPGPASLLTLEITDSAIMADPPRIPADQCEQIFDLFYRNDAIRHGGIPGSGLGLTLARAIAEQHNGTLAVSESDEATTTFTIRLPRGL
ncbi:Histidine kinase-, DNA gyrase B-, and HSP90-like ATPase [Actinoplanes regularis]|uniref:histidine kinase n=2 Tax=Actinoplanes regularis TaxID=52697 RepID=A0A239FMR3_9ACTN|nr:ATP-binding protein [Actinoplanes regularis]GIE89684.1 hypothetical protein Are01nite_61640 [Actinoplanes regularis]SNS58111.1 Histidine kinase-, DNA gyrase B-, and HSP90-like ATPase [Actinoplanes regularis]